MPMLWSLEVMKCAALCGEGEFANVTKDRRESCIIHLD